MLRVQVFTADEDSSLHDATRDKPSQHEVVAGEAGCSSRTQAHQAMVHQHQPGSVSSASHQHQPSLSADEVSFQAGLEDKPRIVGELGLGLRSLELVRS